MRLAALLPLLAPALAQVVAAPGWVRLVPPVVPDTAAYLTLENRGKTPVRLVGATTPIAQRVSLHRDYRETRGGQAVLACAPSPTWTSPQGPRWPSSLGPTT